VVGYEKHVFVCTNERPPDNPRGSCAAKGSEEVLAAFKDAVKSAGLGATVRAQKSGCLDYCRNGVTVVVYPEGVWYGGVTPADVPEIVAEHVVGGRPVERLLIPSDSPRG
jgi:(2Fe-2S) ferredoxin